MHIRYGFDIALNLAQPTTTILTMMDVHSDVRCGVVAGVGARTHPDHAGRSALSTTAETSSGDCRRRLA